MRGKERNKSEFYASKYLGLTTEIDENGFLTGEHVAKYSKPIKYKANISPSTGSSQFFMFGNAENYDSVISPLPVNTDIDENSVLWVETTPNDENDNFDYVVKRKAKSKNYLSLAISKRKVNDN